MNNNMDCMPVSQFEISHGRTRMLSDSGNIIEANYVQDGVVLSWKDSPTYLPGEVMPNGYIVIESMQEHVATPESPHEHVLGMKVKGNSSEYATWQINPRNPGGETYWGNYFSNLIDASKDYAIRCGKERSKEQKNDFIESMIDIAINAGYMIANKQIEINDSRELVSTIIALAEKYEHEDHAFNDYINEIDEFAGKELKQRYGVQDRIKHKGIQQER